MSVIRSIFVFMIHRKECLCLLFPFFRRFKKFFALRYYAARLRRYSLAYRAKYILKRDYLEGTLAIVRLNLKGSA